MYCKSCGSLINDGQSFCSNCGAPVSHPVYQPVPQVTAAVPAAPVKRSIGFSITGLILGVCSVALCFIIFVNFVSILEGLAGAIFSILGLIKKNGKLKVLAVIGLILCVFGMFVSGLMWASFWSKDAEHLFEFLFGWVFRREIYAKI